MISAAVLLYNEPLGMILGVSITPAVARLTSAPLLSYGFRPFFLGAAVWALVAMILWIAAMAGHLNLVPAYGAVAWHAHELLFGYISAVMAGFLLLTFSFSFIALP